MKTFKMFWYYVKDQFGLRINLFPRNLKNILTEISFIAIIDVNIVFQGKNNGDSLGINYSFY